MDADKGASNPDSEIPPAAYLLRHTCHGIPATGGMKSAHGADEIVCCDTRCNEIHPSRRRFHPAGFHQRQLISPTRSMDFTENSKSKWTCFFLVRLARFELASFRRRILSPLCMPFHHSRMCLFYHPYGVCQFICARKCPPPVPRAPIRLSTVFMRIFNYACIFLFYAKLPNLLSLFIKNLLTQMNNRV